MDRDQTTLKEVTSKKWGHVSTHMKERRLPKNSLLTISRKTRRCQYKSGRTSAVAWAFKKKRERGEGGHGGPREGGKRCPFPRP